ncbi:ATP-binding protein [Aeromicrobium wangtongii]|uniref:ATP-binding protein n=1 Tax=Aeromicrobium wangtongii TaxID=2969247 RepID=UPI002017D4B7|nr:DUF4062 domain-containing protein [Aeromicrobium wangtongii]MCL3819354.1 DUF4062 domain-containing protein [Aeromicrobium wangtongii]
MSPIRTPDQRLRVFVSSTLGELAEERESVSRALSALRLTPVMFEAGARPQPPTDLYRAYLAQSDVFIGLYWQEYGQLVPDNGVSGLEDEFELARGMPRLVYLKTPAPDRDPRLSELVKRIEAEASHRRFRTPAELGRLVKDDLAHLLSDRFVLGPPAPSGRAVPSPGPLPISATPLIGREKVIDEVAELHSEGGHRLITLTGPSGIGKTRLAIAVAGRLAQTYDAQTVFVPLEDVTDPGAVLPRIAWAIGADLAGPSPVAALSDVLGDGRWLLVLDNLDRLVEAGLDIAELLCRNPDVSVLATSTTVLGVRAERFYPVPPLPVPQEEVTGLPELLQSPAAHLFLDRARAVRPDISLTDDHIAAVAEICRRLEGVPLAIELAAARLRLLDPAGVLHRLSRSLDSLGAGMADLPPRHRTLRATVEWSFDMLGEAERSLAEVLSVFSGGWSVDAAAHVAGLSEDQALELTETLAQHSLLHVDGTLDEPRPRMLHTVRAFAAERLAARADVTEIRRRHAEYYRALAENADQALRGFRQSSCATLLARENENIAGAVRWHLAHDPQPLPHLFRVLLPFRLLWPFLGLGDAIIGEARSWVAELLPTIDELPIADRVSVLAASLVSALEAGDAEAARAASAELAPLLDEVGDSYLEALSHLLMSWVSVLVRDWDAAGAAVTTALGKLRSLDEPLWAALAAITAGSVEIALGHHETARLHTMEAQRLAGRFDNPWLATVSRVHLALAALTRDELCEARDLLDQALDLNLSGQSVHCLCMVLDASAALSLAAGSTERAGVLAGVAMGLRRRSGLRAYASMRGDGDLAAAIRTETGSELFDELVDRGRRLGMTEALALARDSLRQAAPTT